MVGKQIAVKLEHAGKMEDGEENVRSVQQVFGRQCQPLANFASSVTHLRSLIGEAASNGMGWNGRIRDDMEKYSIGRPFLFMLMCVAKSGDCTIQRFSDPAGEKARKSEINKLRIQKKN